MFVFYTVILVILLAFGWWLSKVSEEECRRNIAKLTDNQIKARLEWADQFDDHKLLTEELARRQKDTQ